MEDASVEYIYKFNQQVKQCIREKHAVSTELAITRNRLNTLLEQKVVEVLSFENIYGFHSFKAKGPSGKYYFFEARGLLGPDEEIYLILHENKPIRVLAPAVYAKAFTADYDLLIISQNISDLGSTGNLPIPDVAHKIFRHRVNLYHKELTINNELVQDYYNVDSFFKKEDIDIGNASERVRILIDLINAKLVGDGDRVVHHSM